MTPKQMIKFLKKKDLKHGDVVSFRVENQISGGYIGPTYGILILEDCIHPYILCNFKDQALHMSIDEGYDAYVGSIQKLIEPYQIFEDGTVFDPKWIDKLVQKYNLVEYNNNTIEHKFPFHFESIPDRCKGAYEKMNKELKKRK